MLSVLFWVLTVALIFKQILFLFLFSVSGKEALDYFKENPALFNTVIFLIFLSARVYLLQPHLLV